MTDMLDTQAYYHVAYEHHTIMNPLREDRLLSVARECLTHPEPRILDIGSGKGYASLLLARHCNAIVTLVDSSPKWMAFARNLFEEHGLASRVSFLERPISDLSFEPGRYDVILCLGTTLLYGGFDHTLDILTPALASEGILIVGELTCDASLPKPLREYLKQQEWEIPSTRLLLASIAAHNLDLLMHVTSTREEWDTYMSLQWLAIHQYARRHPGDEAARGFLEWCRDEQEVYLRYQRHFVDWNVLVLCSS